MHRELPRTIIALLDEAVAKRQGPAYLRIVDGVVADTGGDLARHGLHTVPLGAPAEAHVECLVGVLPAEDALLELPAVGTPLGHADVLIAHRGGADWVLFLDVSQDRAAERRMQQMAYDEALHAASLTRTVDRYVGRSMARAIERIAESGAERRTVTILFADLCGFTDMSARSAPDTVLTTLNAYLDPMLGAILENGGVVDKIIGDAVMGIFGFEQYAHDAAKQALAAAEAIRAAVQAVQQAGQVEPMEVAIGIATGEVVVGVLGHAQRRTITVIGHAVNLAARLQAAAAPGEILVNSTVREEAGEAQYRRLSLNLKGLAGETPAFRVGRKTSAA